MIFHEIRLVGGLFEKKYIDQRALNKKHILREENNIKSPNCVFCGKHHLISSVSKPTLHSSSWQFNWKIYLSIYLPNILDVECRCLTLKMTMSTLAVPWLFVTRCCQPQSFEIPNEKSSSTSLTVQQHSVRMQHKQTLQKHPKDIASLW